MKRVGHNDSKYDYDSLNDTFYAYEPKEEYASSLMFGDIIMDMNEENEFIGVEILNVSDLFGVTPYDLRDPAKLNVHYVITDSEIKLDITFTVVKRNQNLVKNFTTVGANDMNLAPGSATLALA
jgi:uncharacterized protein YuzE